MRTSIVMLMVLTLSVLTSGDFSHRVHPQIAAARPSLNDICERIPMSFAARPSVDERTVVYTSRGPGYSLFLTPTEAVLVLNPAPDGEGLIPREPGRIASTPTASQQTRKAAVLRIEPVGANPNVRLVGLEGLPSRSNLFTGSDPKRWRSNVPNFAKVKYEDVYPGIDLVFYGNQGQLEYDFVVAPGADPERIRLDFGGSEGLALDAAGDLVVRTASGSVVQHRPLVYQKPGNDRRIVRASHVLHGTRQVGFEIADYDAGQALVLDPVITYSTYLGGSGRDEASGVAVDSAGNVYISGTTTSTDFSLEGGMRGEVLVSSDVVVTKLSALGTGVVYTAYLGGDRADTGGGIAVDGSGNAYVTGRTSSTNFPTTANAFQRVAGDNGNGDAFVAKLDASGSILLYSTYLGGRGFDSGYGLAVDASGNTYITGSTESSDFPTRNPFQSGLHGRRDAFVAKLNPSGSDLIYSTFLGGSDSANETGFGIAVDAVGSAYVTGETPSIDFPTVNPIQKKPNFAGPCVLEDFSVTCADAFVTKFSPDGASLLYSTLVGGSGPDRGNSIAVDISGNAYVTGLTTSPDFPTARALQGSSGGRRDAFVFKLNSEGSALVYSTYLGGSGNDGAFGIAVDGAGNAYVAGATDSVNFPAAAPVQGSLSGGSDAFVVKLDPAGSGLLYSTYLGGGLDEVNANIAVDRSGNAIVAGTTFSNNFPAINALRPGHHGGMADFFVTRISEKEMPTIVIRVRSRRAI